MSSDNATLISAYFSLTKFLSLSRYIIVKGDPLKASSAATESLLVCSKGLPYMNIKSCHSFLQFTNDVLS